MSINVELKRNQIIKFLSFISVIIARYCVIIYTATILVLIYEFKT